MPESSALPRPTAPSRPLARPALLLWSGTALLVALVAVALGGAAPQAPPAGLPDAGPVPGWGLPVLRQVQHAGALAAVGSLLAALLADRAPRRRLVSVAAGTWAGASLAALLLGLSEVVASPVQEVLEPDLLRYYALEVPQGRALLLSAALASLVAVSALVVRGRTAVALLLVAGLLALTPPLVNGHAASESDHRLAQATLVVHVLAAVLWTGGLGALALLRRSSALGVAAARYSPLALACATAVGASGLLSAWLRLDPLDQLVTTSYGALVLGKTLLLGVLVALGARHRGRTLPALAAGDPVAFRRLAVGEVAVMSAAFGLAVALSRTPLG